ncbi:MAG: hypothetical protein MUP31_07110 [Xanthomonadales bacterium]|nr:hypothetical protein [Xanthomonadales bacterium]
MCQEQGRNTPTLMVIIYGEGQLGNSAGFIRQFDVASNTDRKLGSDEDCDKGHVMYEVNFGEIDKFPVGEVMLGLEEPVVSRFGAGALNAFS